jgi:hypothetical protein
MNNKLNNIFPLGGKVRSSIELLGVILLVPLFVFIVIATSENLSKFDCAFNQYFIYGNVNLNKCSSGLIEQWLKKNL